MNDSPALVRVSLRVNGRETEAQVEPRMLLVHYLRTQLGLTGTHVGCDTSQCGACTVLMNGVAVKSCNVLTVQADHAEITTIEGVAQDAELSVIQQAFCEHHAIQCGFCTPGFVMACLQLLDRYPAPSEEQIRHQLDGNICRCTGYRGIVRAVQAAAASLRDAGSESPAGVAARAEQGAHGVP